METAPASYSLLAQPARPSLPRVGGVTAIVSALLFSLACPRGRAEPLPTRRAVHPPACQASPITDPKRRTVESPKCAASSITDLKGRTVDPFVLRGKKGILLFFIGHQCPISNAYAPEMTRIAAEYGPKGIAVYGVYAEPDVSARDAGRHSREFGLRFPMLLDPGLSLVRRAGATVTPEAALMSPAGEVLYRGRIDDRYYDFGKMRYPPQQCDLRDALAARLAGKPIVNRTTKAIGCYIPRLKGM